MTNRWPSFDELKHIAKHSPDQLERLRNEEVERVISRAPDAMKKRLRGLQFQIDCQRRLHKNPLASCIVISKMMRDSLQQLNAALQGDFDTASRFTQAARSGVKANVIPFSSSFAN